MKFGGHSSNDWALFPMRLIYRVRLVRGLITQEAWLTRSSRFGVGLRHIGCNVSAVMDNDMLWSYLVC